MARLQLAAALIARRPASAVAAAAGFGAGQALALARRPTVGHSR